MTAPALLRLLTAHGVRLAAHGGRLTFDAPAGAMTPELLGLLKAHKAELLTILAGEPEQKPPAGVQLESRVDREIRRFLAVCKPWPDGRGWYDPGAMRDAAGRAYWQYTVQRQNKLIDNRQV